MIFISYIHKNQNMYSSVYQGNSANSITSEKTIIDTDNRSLLIFTSFIHENQNAYSSVYSVFTE